MSVEQVGPGGVSNSYGVRGTSAKQEYDNDKEYKEVFVLKDTIPLTATVSSDSGVGNLPDPATVSPGQHFFLASVGVGGSWWYSDGTRWRPVGGRVTLYSLPAQVDGVAQAAAQNLAEAKILAKTIQVGDILRVSNAVGKSGTVDSVLRAIRVSPAAAATNGVALAGGNSFPGTTGRSAGEKVEFKKVSATQFVPIGNGSGTAPFSGNSPNALQSPITVSNSDTADIYLSSVLTMTSGSEVPTQQMFVVELIASGG